MSLLVISFFKKVRDIKLEKLTEMKMNHVHETNAYFYEPKRMNMIQLYVRGLLNLCLIVVIVVVSVRPSFDL